MIGAQEEIGDVVLTKLCPSVENTIEETITCTIYEIEWTVLNGLKAEGLLVVPKGKIKASALVIPDADEFPESYAGLQLGGPDVALRLVEQGVQVLIPTLIDREARYSGSDQLIPHNPWKSEYDSISRWTNETHREWIWRQGFVMGKHIIGMEVQKVLAGVKWLKKNADSDEQRIGVMGYGEGGLIALYAAALETNIDVTWVSGYFGPREQLWSEPVYRDIWGLLTEFGDAEIASMIVPRSLIIEASNVPNVKEPLVPKDGQRDDALPGELKTPVAHEIDEEIKRLVGFFPENSQVEPDITFVKNFGQHGNSGTIEVFASKLNVPKTTQGSPPISKYDLTDPQHYGKSAYFIICGGIYSEYDSHSSPEKICFSER